MEIHPLRNHPEYIDILAAALYNEFGHFRPGQTLIDRRRRLEECVGPNPLPNTFIVTERAEVIGSASIVEFSIPERQDLSPWLASVYTFPTHRRKGVATYLTNHVITYTRNLGYRTLYLFTEDKSEFYSRFGWNVIENDHVAGVPVVIMSKDL